MAGGGGGAGPNGAGAFGGPGGQAGLGTFPGQPGINGIGGVGGTGAPNGFTCSTMVVNSMITLSSISRWTNLTYVNYSTVYNNGNLISPLTSVKSGSNLFVLGSTFTGNIGHVLAYSTSLTSQQVMSNFQGMRGIYGV